MTAASCGAEQSEFGRFVCPGTRILETRRLVDVLIFLRSISNFNLPIATKQTHPNFKGGSIDRSIAFRLSLNECRSDTMGGKGECAAGTVGVRGGERRGE